MSLDSRGKHLGDMMIAPQTFEGLDALFSEFQTEEFKALNERQKIESVNRHLLRLLQESPAPAFLLSSVICYIDRVVQEKVLDHYNFSSFELWLNQFSGLKAEENYRVRAQIVGKWIPRETYQLLFPIGMGKMYAGSHFVTAHQSPDLDTTIASFWGWVDAFGARVSEGLHLWNIPGGPNLSQVEIPLLFQQPFGENIFQHLSKTRTTLAISSLDLLTQKGLVRKHTSESSLNIDHEGNQSAVILIDEHGYYLGDWGNFDGEGVRQVITLLNHCLRWFEHNLYLKLISLFGKENLSLNDLPDFVRAVFGTRIRDSEPAREFTAKQKKHLQDYLSKVLRVKQGINSTFEDFASAMKKLSIFDFKEFVDLIESLQGSTLFNRSGSLVEDRPLIFHTLEKIILGLDKAIQSVRSYVERLDVALSIKTEVFGYFPQVLNFRADVDEMRGKMGSYPYLTVVYSDKEGRLSPMGIVQSTDLQRPILGTVSLRDFCNREETKIPSYLEVISVIDHHKSQLNTLSPMAARIADAQSANCLVAEIAFQINDQYSTGGMSLSQIETQMKDVQKKLSTPADKRILQRLLQRHIAASHPGMFFIDSEREFMEYLHFLYAIIDDTDLLTKVSYRDIECIASLLNRLKSLMVGREEEIIAFDDLARDNDFVKHAAKRILQNADMYSLYQKIYHSKESAIEQNLRLCAERMPSSIFADTKEQNGCCRISQTKMFANNFPTYFKYADQLRTFWCEESALVHKEKSEIDLYLHMVSTLSGAQELFQGKPANYTHRDEMWIWIPETEPAIEHLKSFLNAFKGCPQVIDNEIDVEFLGKNHKELDQIFADNFFPIPRTVPSSSSGKGLPIAVLHFRAGSINSRKAMISPYLPRVMS